MVSRRNRVVLLVVISVLAIGGGIAYFVKARADVRQQQASAPDVNQVSNAAGLLAAPHVIFRSSALGNTYGQLAIVPLSNPGGPRGFFSPICERVYATKTDGVCITADRGVTASYSLKMLDASMTVVSTADLAGLPSRARISPDGSLVSTTTFVTGHSYAESSFSTQTILRKSNDTEIGNIENFKATVDGKPFTSTDRNYWGVTFVDDDSFYATASSATAGKTWLMKGSISAQTMTSLRTDAECPSVSPDHTRVAFKVRLGNPAPGQWHLAVLDLATGKQTVLAEPNSVDDQVEWLDDAHVLYARPRSGTEATTSDIWQVPADGSGTPSVFIPQASSPAVVRN